MMLESVCSPIKRLISDVLSMKIGICAREIELVEVSSGRCSQEFKDDDMVDDRFLVKIPISDHYMTWEIVFNSSFPNCPPDFDLNDTDFFYYLASESVEVLLPSLTDWDFRKEKALVNVISELRSAYLKYQVERLESIDNRCAFEYTSLINERNFLADRIEVYSENNIISFLIKLEVNLPTASLSADESYIVLSVKFGALASARCCNIHSSSQVIEAIGAKPELPRNINSDESLSDYVEEVSRWVEEQALTVMMNRQKKRKLFIFEMLKHLGHSVVSYDALEYNHAAFLLQKDGFVCILEVLLPSLFPKLKPNYKLISVYSTPNSNVETPLAQKIQVPYNEGWDSGTMVEQAVNVIRNKHLNNFKEVTSKIFRIPK